MNEQDKFDQWSYEHEVAMLCFWLCYFHLQTIVRDTMGYGEETAIFIG